MIPAAILLIALVGANLLGWVWIWTWAQGRDEKARIAVDAVRGDIEAEVRKQLAAQQRPVT